MNAHSVIAAMEFIVAHWPAWVAYTLVLWAILVPDLVRYVKTSPTGGLPDISNFKVLVAVAKIPGEILCQLALWFGTAMWLSGA